MDLLPSDAMLELGRVMEEGSKKYAPDNWRKVEIEKHMDHAIRHIFLWLADKEEVEELSHATCRLVMALELVLNKGSF